MDNPYASPKLEAAGGGEGLLPLPPRMPSWAVAHIRTVAVLMLVQGAIEAIFGLGLAVMTGLMCIGLRVAPNQPQDERAVWMIVGIYAGISIVTLIAAGLHLVAGYRNYFYRGHTLGIVALGSSILHVFILCCFPTGAALAIYGLIVYLNSDAVHAFRLAESGHSVEAVHATYV